MRKLKEISKMHSNGYEERFYALFENVPNMAVQGYLADGTVQYWNKASERLYGYTAEEALGCNLLDLIIPEEGKEDVRHAIHMMGEEGKPLPASELTLKRKDGSLVTVFSSHSVLKRSDGNNEFFCMDIDISEQKNAIERVKKSEERQRKLQQLFRNMVDIMPDMLWAKDLNKNYIFVNQSICKNLLNAKDTDEPIGKNDMYFATRERESHRDNPEWHTFGEICQDSDSIVLETKMTGQFDEFGNVKGRFLYLDVLKTPLKDEHGQIMGVVGTARDVTAYKESERKLVEAKIKAEESDKLKTAFINNISHEMRTPLNGILGFGHIMAYSNLSEKERQAYYQILQQSADRLIQTVTDYMDISLISTLSIIQNKQYFNLSELMAELLEKTRDMLAGKKIQVKLDLPDDSDDFKIFTDRELLRKVLHHLLDNARKFTAAGAIIFGYRYQQDEIRFFVSDTGVGIAFNKLNNIFDVFIQEETAMSRGYEGSGLGLAIVKGIVTLLGGAVQVDSEKGKGASFLFTIPCETAQSGKDSTKQLETESRHAGHRLLLVVEDLDTDNKFLKIILTHEGYHTMHARNGLEAVELCQQHPEISLVLMDIKLPVMDGVQATKRIKELRADLPVIGVSAYANTGEEHIAKQAGCDDFISKPVQRDLLIKTVRKYLPVN